MIELPQQYPPPPTGPRRSVTALVVAAVLVLVVAVALVNGHRTRAARQAADRRSPASSAPPSPSTANPPDQLDPVPRVACPQIRDEESRLAYRCIDDRLLQDDPDIYLGLRIALDREVETDWVISEGSGNPRSLAQPPTDTEVVRAGPKAGSEVGSKAGLRANPRPLGPSVPSADRVRDEVRRRAALALARAYGDNPSGKVLDARTRSFAGVPGYEVLTEITINPAYRESRHLGVRVERLWVVGLPTTAGVSIFMLSIPDARKDLWPKAEATIATLRVL